MTATTGLLLAEPSLRLEMAFRVVAQRMRGLAFVNPAIEVEAIGFAPWEGAWLGVMVTPWFMNLMLLPRDPCVWQALAIGAKRSHAFPAGTYEFIGAREEAIGEYHACSLFSPLLEFADHASVRLVAGLARAALFDPANAEAPRVRAAALSPDTVGAESRPLADLEKRLAAPITKRDFLRGSFVGGES